MDDAPPPGPDTPPPRDGGRGGLWLGLGLGGCGLVLCLLGIPLALIMPAVSAARAAAQRSVCEGNLTKLALATLSYEAAERTLPPLAGGPATSADDGSAAGRLAWYVTLLPYLEEAALAERIGVTPPPPDDPRYVTLAEGPLPAALCPADPAGAGHTRDRRSYRANLGQFVVGNDAVPPVGTPADDPLRRLRGPFVRGRTTRLTELADGTGATLLFGEAGLDGATTDARGRALWQVGVAPDGDAFRRAVLERTEGGLGRTYLADATLNPVGHGPGTRWADGSPYYAGFTTVLPPGRASGLSGGDLSWGIVTPTSFHPRGCQFATADGATSFLPDDVDAELFDQLGSQADGASVSVP